MVDDEARRGVDVTVGEAGSEDPASNGDTKVAAEEATVVEDAAMVEVEANVVEVDKALLVDADMAGLLVLFGRRDSLSLSIFYTSTRRCF